MEKVSIIITCTDQDKFVSKAIESALKQTYPDIEIIVIDNASRDNSWKIIDGYRNNHQNIKFLDEKEYYGISDSKNKAVSAASGKYIIILNAQDTIAPTFIEKAVKIFEKKQDTGFVYSKVKNLKTGQKLKDIHVSKLPFENIVQGSALYKKSDLVDLDYYKKWMRDGYEDWDLWLSLTEKGLKPTKINEYLYNKYPEGNRLTRSEKLNLYGQILKAHLHLYSENEIILKKIFDNSKINLLKKFISFFAMVSLTEFIILVILLFF